MPTTVDRIEKQILLHAPRSRVWRALTDSTEFGAWFGAELKGKIAPGAKVTVEMSGTTCGHAEAKALAEKANSKSGPFQFVIAFERMEPESFLSYRWHPYAIDRKVDYSSETPTLVEFRLEEVGQDTRLTVIESGFEQLPAARRAEAFRMNDGGWAAQLKNIERHVTSN